MSVVINNIPLLMRMSVVIGSIPLLIRMSVVMNESSDREYSAANANECGDE